MDWNSDGLRDLVSGDREGYFNVFIESGSGLTAYYKMLLLNGDTIDVGYNSQPAVADWNLDGKKDLLLGTQDGYICLYLNQATNTWPMFQGYTYIQSGGSPINLYRINPYVVDLDRDGKRDLVCGANDGYIHFFRNVGSDTNPTFAGEESLQTTGGIPIQPSGLPYGSRCDFGDWNNDGAIDFLISGYDGYIELYLGETVTPSYFISGYARYYWTPYRAVPNTEMNLTGGQITSTLTDVNGYYIFSNLTGALNYTVTPEKTNTVRDPYVSSYDAALVLRHVVGSITLTPLQQIAGDVSNNGSLSSYDAALILRYVVNIIQHFPSGDWKFQPTSISYTPLNSNQTDQNYAAILCGDVSGNWQPTDLIPIYSNPAGTGTSLYYGDNFINIKSDDVIAIEKTSNTTSAELTLNPIPTNHTTVETEKTTSEQDLLSFPIELKQAKSVISADIILKYDPKTISLVDIKTTATTLDFLYAYTDQAGIIRIGMAGTKELNGNRTILNVRFKKNNATDTDTKSKLTVKSLPVEVLSLMTNEHKIKESSDGVAGNYIEVPTRLSLMANQPNPFKTQTAIRYSLPIAGKVSLQIYDVKGTLVKTLINQIQNPGFYSIQWDGTNGLNQKVASGIYFYELRTDNFTAQKKLTILR